MALWLLPVAMGLLSCIKMKSPHQLGSQCGEGVIYFASRMAELFLFSLPTSNDDRGSAQDEHDASDVEDRGTDAAGGG